MSKGFKIAALAGAMSMVLSGAALAAATPAFVYDGWTVSKGDINENAGGMCADQAYTCSVVASGKGFKQINVSERDDASSGTSYIMTIVTDQDAGALTGSGASEIGFSDVSFVRMNLTLGGTSGGGESGITASQKITETGGGKSFLSKTDINTGWASAAVNGANIKIEQNLTDDGKINDFVGDDFSSGFIYRSKNDAITGDRVGFEMSIDQVARLANARYTDATETKAAASVNDVQVFALREKQGTFVTAGNATGIDLNTDDNVSPITWAGDATATNGAAGDDIKAMWIGQQINLGDGVDIANGSLGSSFGYVSFENVTDQKSDSAFGFSDTNAGKAWKWDDAFFIDESTVPALPAAAVTAP